MVGGVQAWVAVQRPSHGTRPDLKGRPRRLLGLKLQCKSQVLMYKYRYIHIVHSHYIDTCFDNNLGSKARVQGRSSDRKSTWPTELQSDVSEYPEAKTAGKSRNS